MIDLGLKVQYSSDLKLRKWFKCVISLALIPPDQVSNGLEYLMDKVPDYDLEKFLDYVVETWIENNNHPISMWNHYNNLDDPRTNNHIEGYHLRLDKFIVNKKPNIWYFIEQIKKEESTYSLNFTRLERGLLRIKVMSRKDIERDNSILKKRCEYLTSNNSNKLEEFLESLSDVIHEYD